MCENIPFFLPLIAPNGRSGDCQGRAPRSSPKREEVLSEFVKQFETMRNFWRYNLRDEEGAHFAGLANQL
jgi:hypothetical protein